MRSQSLLQQLAVVFFMLCSTAFALQKAEGDASDAQVVEQKSEASSAEDKGASDFDWEKLMKGFGAPGAAGSADEGQPPMDIEKLMEQLKKFMADFPSGGEEPITDNDGRQDEL